MVEKLYRLPAHEVSVFGLKQPAMDRVLLLDADQMEEVFADESLRARIGYPDQLGLPLKRNFAQKARYPRRMGIGQVVAALEERLEALGVRILRNTTVVKIEEGSALWLQDASGKRKEAMDRLFWTAGLSTLWAVLMEVPLRPQPLPKAAHVHLRFREPPRMGELYHFYVLDEGFCSFRVTHYGNYCDAAKNDLGWPICVEYWPQGVDKVEVIADKAVAELMAMGVVTEAPIFQKVQMMTNYHGLFSVARVRENAKFREDIKARAGSSLFTAGIMAEAGELLLYEIAQDMYSKIQACCEAQA